VIELYNEIEQILAVYFAVTVHGYSFRKFKQVYYNTNPLEETSKTAKDLALWHFIKLLEEEPKI